MININEVLEKLDQVTKQKDQAYAERNKVVAALAEVLYGFKSLGLLYAYEIGIAKHPIEDENWENDWRTILVIESPVGQMTWHFHDSEVYLLEGLPEITDYKWDGHTTEEKYQRLFKIAG